jgi:hypothetical protein
MARRGTIMPEKERASQEQIHKPGAGWLAGWQSPRTRQRSCVEWSAGQGEGEGEGEQSGARERGRERGRREKSPVQSPPLRTLLRKRNPRKMEHAREGNQEPSGAPPKLT